MQTLSAKELKQRFGIEFKNDVNLSLFAGLAPFIAYLEKGRFLDRLTELFGSKTKARALMQLCLSIIVGAQDMEEAERVSEDRLIKAYLGKAVSATQLSRTFKGFMKSEVAALHEFAQALAILEICNFVKKDEFLDINIDATAVRKFGEQEGVEAGYVDKDTIKPCYQFLLFHLQNLNTFLYGTIRGGAAHSQNGFCGYLERFLPLFRSQWNLRIRADSGFFNEEAFALMSQHCAKFFVKAPQSTSRKSQAASPNIIWTPSEDESDVSYGSYFNATTDAAPWREVFKRIKKDSWANEHFVFYEYHCVATNDMLMKEPEVFNFYNGRANIENNIKELKEDYQLGKIVTDSFDANDVITQATVISYILVQHFKRVMLDKADQNKRLSTLRWRLFNIPGRALQKAHRLWQRIYNAFCPQQVYARIYARLIRLNTFLVCPPTLAP
jgi:Transposase DDE domain group 1